MHYTSQDSEPFSLFIVATDYAILFGGEQNEVKSFILYICAFILANASSYTITALIWPVLQRWERNVGRWYLIEDKISPAFILQYLLYYYPYLLLLTLIQAISSSDVQ
jgi:hypothetical protein